MLLALDTSTSFASLALVAGETLLAELTWAVGQRHSTEMLQRLDWLLTTHGVAAEALTGITVATGPGSFNGVRVALATAKSLAFALGIPLYAVPTLDVIAWGQARASGTLCAVLEAGRGQVYAASYAAPAASAKGWAPLDGYQIVTPAELAAGLGGMGAEGEAGPVLICGEWHGETQIALAEALGERARFASPLASHRAAWLAELALARAAHGLYDDFTTVEPLYLRRPAITTSTRSRGREQQRDDARQVDAVLGGEGEARALRG